MHGHTGPMDRAVIDALRAQQAELAAIVAGATADDLLLPSRCPGWTVADVLLHLAQTDEMAVASAEGRVEAYMAEAAEGMAPGGSNVDDWAGALVDKERGEPLTTLERWRVAAGAQVDALARCDGSERLTWVAGQLAARTLATTRLTEAWIHTVDVAVAFGPPPPPTDRLWHTARLAWRTLPYALARAGAELHGSVAFELEAPDGSTWSFGVDDHPTTTVTGSALDLCTVAGQRADAADTSLRAEGPDAEAVLCLVRTFA